MFSVVDTHGVYQLTVVDAVHPDYVFDAENSVLSASLDTTAEAEAAPASPGAYGPTEIYLPLILKR